MQTQQVVGDQFAFDAFRARRIANENAAQSMGAKSWSDVVEAVAFEHGAVATVDMEDFEVIAAFEAIREAQAQPWFGPRQ